VQNLARVLVLCLSACTAQSPGTDSGPRTIPDTGVPCVRWTSHESSGQSTDGTVRFRLTRSFCAELPPGWAFSAGCPVYADRFELTYGGTTRVVADPSQIAYTASHHHGLDAIEASTAEERMRWRIHYDAVGDGQYHHFVSSTSVGGATLLAETEMVPGTCDAGPAHCVIPCL
jgi:hypothetical protein